MFKTHLQTLTQATHPCAAAYDYARIRRLVRLETGLYRFRVADESAIGFDRPNQSRRASVQDLIQALSEISCRGGCAWDTFGCAGFVRPAWAQSCGCKSHRKLTTANEVKRNCMRVTECGEEAWSEAAS